MKRELYYYDIYPMVFPVGKTVDFTVKPMAEHSAFSGDYTVIIQRFDSGSMWDSFTSWNHTDIICTADENGCLHFKFTAEAECEHCIRVYKGTSLTVQLSVYALAEDLAARYPLRGDLHVHTCRSDGSESPAFVCANYRKRGYDFIVITDHGRYYPSLEAIKSFSEVNIPLNILPGEEVHLPLTDVHIVNAGGLFSVNGLFTDLPNYTDTKGDMEKRRFDETVNAPDVITMEQYEKEIAEIEAGLTDVPADINSKWYAVSLWTFDKIREADGLGIFAHPYWISDMWQIHEPFTRYMLKKHPFDAFEVLGGENYYVQNGFQTAIYYEEYKEGRVHPIVGSTDSHGCTEHNRDAAICSTIVFAEKNDRSAVLDAIRGRYSVAVDTISEEYRLVGEHRLQKYACFLMENYFPVHDRQAAMDGELMVQYVAGNATREELELISARAERLMKKYIMIAE